MRDRSHGPARFRRWLGAGVALVALVSAGDLTGQEVPPEPETYHACYVPLTGTIYRIKAPRTRPACASTSHVAFSWNQEGPVGPKGEPGDPAEFSGTLTSPDGNYSLAITNDGILLDGPSGSVSIDEFGVSILADSGKVTVVAADDFVMSAGRDATLKATNDLTIKAAANPGIPMGNLILSGVEARIEAARSLFVESGGALDLTSAVGTHIDAGLGLTLDAAGPLRLTGSLLSLNGGCKPVARVGDHVTGTILTGSPTVLSC